MPSKSKTLTMKDLQEITKISRAALTKYVTGAYQPQLHVEKVIEGGRAVNKIHRDTFDAWWKEYQAKKPFGSRLHKDRVGK